MDIGLGVKGKGLGFKGLNVRIPLSGVFFQLRVFIRCLGPYRTCSVTSLGEPHKKQAALLRASRTSRV